MRALTFLLLVLLTTACSDPAKVPEAGVSEEPPQLSGPISSEAMAQWARNCALCHVRGEGGAPVLGDADAWAPRIAQGDEVLLAHTLEGLNNMPPLGYCMDCEEADFRQIITFLSGRGEGGAR
jgi:cytochrome c5